MSYVGASSIESYVSITEKSNVMGLFIFEHLRNSLNCSKLE